MMKLILVLMTVLSCVSNAETLPVQYLQKNNPAPFTGYLFTPEQEKFIRHKVEQNEILINITKKQEEILILYENDNKELNKEIQRKEVKSFFNKILYGLLGLGIGFIAGTVYGR